MPEKSRVMPDNPINIMFSINKAHLIFAMITLNSLLIHNSSSFFEVYLVNDGGIKENDIQKYQDRLNLNFNNFRIILVDISKHKSFNIINTSSAHWGKEIFYKVLSYSLFPQLERILCLDTDTVCNGDIHAIYNHNLKKSNGEFLFIADQLFSCKTNKVFNRLNVGILLINLKACRKKNVEAEWLEELNSENLTEEEALNRLYFNDTLILSKYIYTLSSRREKISPNEFYQIRLFHFVGRKPWLMPTYRRFGIRTTLLWYEAIKPFIKENKKISYYLIKIYGVFCVMFLYSLCKKIWLGRKIYNSAWIFLQKIIV